MDTLVLFLILREKFLVSAIVFDVGSGFLVYGLYYVEVLPLYSNFAECFYHKWVLYLIKCFFYVYGYDCVILVFASVYVVYYVY